ncbi:RpiB/LacA/LacB family sugar-phosphate isomerase [Telmatocola sphagniphila]|uniref:RpiB/LacA/LacB family sugar-phosphate isomerase n=1 Tax=Telmatocola sphagniphila TaxID=1123043 RepID=A0A8E6B9X5_9BACT|nr:RpiB/LacA/LacB family sugar-phosphate isomerase [Telmatocola sphagniphila]QVL34082.1 RpiB/LacA/LacB family sugar-phosphate isomerase [Telmatocola sphagniphila]
MIKKSLPKYQIEREELAVTLVPFSITGSLHSVKQNSEAWSRNEESWETKLLQPSPKEGKAPRKVGIAADHGGYNLKEQIAVTLLDKGFEVVDFGAYELNPEDDYPDFIIPLARAIASEKVERGVALCGSGVGATIAANKIASVRAGLIHDLYSAHQGVEDDDMNVFCLGGQVIGSALAIELIEIFLSAKVSGAVRHIRRRAMVAALEQIESTHGLSKTEPNPRES